MRSLITGSMRARRGIMAAAAVIFAFGAWQLRHADLDSLPEIAPTVVEVQTEPLGLSAEEMEQLITVPLEQDLLNGVAWMDSIRSQSVPGLSSIVMEFEPGTDLYHARQVVQERLNEAHAPGKGPVRVEPVGGEEQETLVLTEHRTVDAATLDRIRDAALRLDERAYRFLPKVWSRTSPAVPD